MDLIVQTNGAVHCISGVNEATTCAQVVYALAHATQQRGRFVLVASAKHLDREHRFAPNERPFEFVQESNKKGSEVAFDLRQLSPEKASDRKGSQAEATDCGSPVKNGHSREASSATLAEVEVLTGKNDDEYGTPPTLSATSSYSALPDAVSESCTNKRPPPPDYNRFIEERCNSLKRNTNGLGPQKHCSLTFMNIHNFALPDLYKRNFSRQELEALVDIQERTLAAQKQELVRMEMNLLNADERQLIQLKKQHNNLQTVLNSLRNANWPGRIEAEKAESERLHTAIAAMRTAIENKRRELLEALQLQQTLELQYAREKDRTPNGFECEESGVEEVVDRF